MDRDQILARYRQLRGISTAQHSAALAMVPQSALLRHAKRIGVARGHVLMFESEAEVPLLMDLAVYGHGTGGTSAIERYASKLPADASDDEITMVHAKLNARFSVWRVQRRHEIVGLWLTNLLHRSAPEEWLVDEAMEASCPDGLVFAARLAKPDAFSISCGVVAPVTPETVYELIDSRGRCLWQDIADIEENSRFAAALYRAAIRSGVMERVEFR
jgi:hypothetical protein